MNTIINKHFSVKKIIGISFFPFLIFSIIYCSAYAYTTYDSSSILYYVLFLTVYLSIAYINVQGNLSIYDKKNIYQNKEFWVLFFTIFGLVFSMIVNEKSVTNFSYYRTISTFLSAFLITKIINFNSFVNLYIKILSILSVISLIVYFYVNFIGSLGWSIFTNSNDVSYYNGFINFVMVHSPERNTGVFWEPGIFSTFLIIGILFETIFKPQTNWYIVFLFLVTNITTLSTASYFLLIILILIGVNRSKNSLYRVLINIIIFIIMVFVWTYQVNIVNTLANYFPSIFGKLDVMNGSVTTRIMGPWVDVNIFIENFFTGVGFSEYQLAWREIASSYGVVSQTSTLTYFMATLGVVGMIYVISIFYGILTFDSIKVMQRIFLLILFLFILTKEPHQNNLLMNTILFYFIGGKELIFNDLKRIPQ